MGAETHNPYECSDLACAECWEFHLQAWRPLRPEPGRAADGPGPRRRGWPVMTATSRRVNPLARQSGGRHADPRRVKRPPLTSPEYVGKHRPPAPVARTTPHPLHPDVLTAEGLFVVLRHLADGRTEEDAWALAEIDVLDMAGWSR